MSFGTWRDELERKIIGGQHHLAGELRRGALLIVRRLLESAQGRRGQDAPRVHGSHARGSKAAGERQARLRARARKLQAAARRVDEPPNGPSAT